jgi:acyl-[acyl-carrier-protein] desaturase
MQYEAYYELAERNGWRVSDLDWDQLQRDVDAGAISDHDRGALQGTAVIEHGVPHYAEVWSLVEHLRDHWQLWQFTTLWTGEEHRHSFALKKTCEVLGVADEIERDFEAVAEFPFAREQKQSCELDCYRSVPGMLTYAIIQELATNRFYLTAAKRSNSPFLKKLFTLIAGDEMRHHCFYRDALHTAYETSTDRAWFVEQVFPATQAIKMPHLI